MIYKGDIYLLSIGMGMTMISDSPSSKPDDMKTIGIARGVEIEFDEYSEDISVEEYNAKLQKQIDALEARKI